MTDHIITLTQLRSETKYYFTVSSTDVAGNAPVTSSRISFTTDSIPDDVPPVFTVAPDYSDITTTSATIQWETDELASGDVIFDVNPDVLTDVTATTDLGTSQLVMLTNLKPGTTYYYLVRSVDQSQNFAMGIKDFFTTEALPAECEGKLPGDINNDCKVNATDVQLVINAALGIDIGGLDADINNDKATDAEDVQFVINVVPGLDISDEI